MTWGGRSVVADDAVVAKRAGPLDGVFQFADIARPAVVGEHIHGFRIDFFRLGAGVRRVFLKEVIDEQRDVVEPLAERRAFRSG